MYKWLFLSAALLMVSQTPSVVNAQSVQVRPILIAPVAPKETPVELRNVVINTEITGPFARTEIELTFFNPNRRVLEGELEFPLLEGQSVTGFALDFNGKWRDAVAVEKPKAQQIFEDVTRQQVDPALLQVTRGNNYKVRVYPLPAMGIRKVKLVVSERVQQNTYKLPLLYTDVSRLRVNILTDNTEATLKAPTELEDLEFQPRGANGQKLQFERLDFSGTGTLEIALPETNSTETFVQNFDGQRYFMAVIPRQERMVKRAPPAVVDLWWDSSLSGLKRDHQKELQLLEQYFARFQNLQVRLTRFSNEASPREVFEVQNGNWSALRQALNNTVYDGGTDFDALSCAPDMDSGQGQPLADCAGASERLIFTDGLDNMTNAELKEADVPTHVISSGSSNDPVRLKHLTAGSGQTILLNRMSMEQALNALVAGRQSLENLTAQGAKDLVVSETADAFLVAGILNASTAQVSYTLDGQPETLKVSASATRSNQVAQLWASWKIEDLRGEERLNQGQIRRIGKAFNLVTPQTSLLVLDTVQDYVRYDINPPAELQAEFQSLKDQQAQAQKQDKADHTSMVLGLLQDYENWWKKDFPKDTPPKPEPAKKSDGTPLPSPTFRSETGNALALPSVSAPDAEMYINSISDTAGMAAERSSGESPASSGNQISIQLKKWTSDAPYIRRMQEAKASDLYRIYLDERPEYENSTAFYLDVADQLFDKKLPELALKVLSNLSELQLENRAILRIQAYRYLQAGYPELALPILEQVADLAPYEPQSFRDLGLAHAQAGNPQKAIENLYRVVDQRWDGRFSEVELIALNELNAIIHSSAQPLDTRFMDPRFIKDLPVDLRVVLTWDADNSDMDLWVTDPNDEKVYYGHRLSYQGGRISRDMTGGYGPEEFSLKVAKKGKYSIQTNYYGNRQQILAGAVTLQAKLITGFGTPKQQEQIITLRLKDRSETVFVGEFEVK
ncbi:VIT domain-containing protein [Deinococcus misasensis]|uniref:VIT domain-containing protein n=1 Tax=Deinococcus misasensis TaxID=392413 RepID=UPI00054D3BA8|nr:VIT domain-containing protein [Deinococcus misasensis]